RRWSEAERSYRQAVALLRQLTAAFPNRLDYHSQLGHALHQLACLVLGQGELAGAQALLEQALHHQQTALKSNAEYPDYRQLLTDHYRELLPLLFRLGRHREAARHAEGLAGALPERSCSAYAAARALVRCAALVEQEAALTPAERHTRAEC